MLRDKTLIWLLLLYMLFQLGALLLGAGLLVFVYVVAYVIAIIYSAIKLSKAVIQEVSMKAIAYSATWFFIANLVLFLIYVPTVILNPEINWKLKGQVEQDPMILQAYVPIVFFLIAVSIMTLTIISTKLVWLYKTRRTSLTQP